MINAIRKRVNEDIVVLSDTLSKPKKYKQHWNARAVRWSQLLCPVCRTPFTCIAFRKGLARLLCGHWRGSSI